MLSWSCSGSSPTPGRHSGRMVEWHTDTRTDMRTVWQPSCACCCGAPWWLGTTEECSAVWPGAGVHPPELSDISPTNSCSEETRGASTLFRHNRRLFYLATLGSGRLGRTADVHQRATVLAYASLVELSLPDTIKWFINIVFARAKGHRTQPWYEQRLLFWNRKRKTADLPVDGCPVYNKSVAKQVPLIWRHKRWTA